MNFLDKCFTWFIYGFIVLFTLICFIPFWMIIIGSFASESSIQTNGYQLFPSEFSLYSYEYLLAGKQVFTSYGVTLIVTIAGTALAVLITAMYAYVLAHPKVKYRKIMAFLTYFTMIFGAGLVGFYILISSWLGLKDSIWSLILPYLLNPFFAFILVSFYRTIPYELNEAATVDGANDIYIFFKIIWPVAVPAIATTSLFYALQYWNDWYLALLFIDDHTLHPLQIMIRQLISNINAQAYVAGSNTVYSTPIPSRGVQLATVCLTIGPIILFYPFIQKYFVKGLTVGAVKG
ncbi:MULTISPECIES: carbohydrate ABC transporter permease [unclassified Paenibacillus]|uniref:carbohydrate ABC transporter permease n=1 Tax=unclassified Paenibacillus TaxID=185978 RepID=UPI001E4F8428|nr:MULTISPECIES: carbohydrate ABC transporter permease [unclassified Paenibacillus]CAH0121795.1 L-arabinose transport system permease protein AraQ [Paenibacillus sp. CECT 9249]